MPETIGDVKYSILEPNIFKSLNPGWELLTKQPLEPTSPLGLLGVMELPDGRGVFIRSMNENRDPAEGDAGGNRSIGSYQKDIFEKHNHDISYANNEYTYSASGMGIQSNSGHEVQRTHLAITVLDKGGAETRPRNIVLYLYIKTS